MARGKSKMTANVRRLVEEREKLVHEIALIQTKIDGLDHAISILQREDFDRSTSIPPMRRGAPAKSIILELLHAVRGEGLVASSAVELAAKHGIQLARGSAASTLSRLKTENVVVYDGTVYRLPEYVRPQLEIHAGGKGS